MSRLLPDVLVYDHGADRAQHYGEACPRCHRLKIVHAGWLRRMLWRWSR